MKHSLVNKKLVPLLRCGALSLLMGSALIGSTPDVVQAAEQPVPLTGTIHFSTAKNTLQGTKWELISPVFEGAAKTPFLNFSDASIGAGVGLNVVGGEYSVSGQKIRVKNLFSTQMAGSPELMQAEDQFLKALQGARSYAISNDGKTLILRGRQTLTFRLKDAAQTLAWTEWELASPTLSGAAKTPYLNFTANAIGAGVGLNLIGGEYSISGHQMSLKNLLSTRMAGPPELMQAEDRFTKALNATQTYEVTNNGQTLILRGGETLTFRLKAHTPQGFVATETKIINVAPQLGPQMDGDQTPQYLQLEDLSPRVGWGRFTEQKIEGFEFEPGYRYQLRVQVERNPRTNEKRLRLLEIFSQQWMETSPLATNQKILEVAPTKVDCAGVGQMQCLQVREVGGQWKALHAPIEGFNFQPGWRYRLQVAETPVENPPADAPNVRYTLVRLLDKIPVTY